MSSTTIDSAPHVPWFRRAGERETVETLRTRIARLQQERQDLRERRAPRVELERNRLGLACCQWELGHALIERYLPGT